MCGSLSLIGHIHRPTSIDTASQSAPKPDVSPPWRGGGCFRIQGQITFIFYGWRRAAYCSTDVMPEVGEHGRGLGGTWPVSGRRRAPGDAESEKDLPRESPRLISSFTNDIGCRGRLWLRCALNYSLGTKAILVRKPEYLYSSFWKTYVWSFRKSIWRQAN